MKKEYEQEKMNQITYHLHVVTNKLALFSTKLKRFQTSENHWLDSFLTPFTLSTNQIISIRFWFVNGHTRKSKPEKLILPNEKLSFKNPK